MHVLTRVRRSEFLRHNAIFFVGSVVTGVLNYAYYPVLGRMLRPAAFGEVQTLISLFLQLTIFLSVLGLVTVNIVANYRSINQRNAVVLEFERLALVVACGLLAATIIFEKQLVHFLRFSDVWPFLLLMIALVVTVPGTFRAAYLRGVKSFGRAAGFNVLAAGGKLVFSILLVLIGLGTAGAIGGLIMAQLVAWLFAATSTRRFGLAAGSESRWRLPSAKLLAPELRYGAFVLCGSLLVTLQYSLDVLVVKHFFDPHTAGLYAGVASVARIIFFLTAPVALVLMPLVKTGAAPAANRKTLVKSLALFAMAGTPPLVVSMVYPQETLRLLMGHAYASMAFLLPLLSLAVFIISLLNVVIAYFLALRSYSILPAMATGALVTYGLLFARHATLRAVILDILFGSLAMLVAVCAWAGTSTLKELAWQKS